jgi:hypothetical protein
MRREVRWKMGIDGLMGCALTISHSTTAAVCQILFFEYKGFYNFFQFIISLNTCNLEPGIVSIE